MHWDQEQLSSGPIKIKTLILKCDEFLMQS